jgi:predicted 3-demethylubiquinone-9 3-methyltransferase (glyoxalase superfamily)
MICVLKNKIMNNDIFPCLWHNEDAKEAAEFYCKVFSGKITADTPVVMNIDLFGQKIMLLNGGPQFEKNASVSFMVMCESDDEVQNYWNQLSDGGIVLMELGEYPWSKKYGWVRDQFGTTWQLYLGEKQGEQKIIPTLMFIHQNNGKAYEAMGFYTHVFPNSKIGGVLKYGDGVGNESHEVPENVQHAHFEIDGYSFFCMDNSYDHKFDFNEGISMVVMTDNQEETDHLWNALTSDGGRESMCGWLKDQFGMSWQIVPKKLIELMNDSDQLKAQKVVQAMMKMQKIVIKDLEEAYHS